MKLIKSLFAYLFLGLGIGLVIPMIVDGAKLHPEASVIGFISLIVFVILAKSKDE